MSLLASARFSEEVGEPFNSLSRLDAKKLAG
jgi:hypothetical protein